jgi:hypothetical protein
MAPATEEWLLDSIAEQSILVVEGMRSMLGRTTTSFLDAATKLSLAAGSLRSLPAAARRPVLETLLSASTVLRDILGGLVRGLPQEIVMMLDELSAGHPSPSPA